MEPIAQCLNDGKPYKEGAGTFKLLAPSSNGTAGTNGTLVPPAAAGDGKKTSAAAGSVFVTNASAWMAGVGMAITAMVSAY